MRYVLIFVFTFGYCVSDDTFPPVFEYSRFMATPSEHQLLRNQHIEVQAGLFEGDIVMDDETYTHMRLGYNKEHFRHRLWPSGVAPYKISDKYNKNRRKKIIDAIEYINNMTCIKLTPRNGKHRSYIFIRANRKSGGCSSNVGRKGGRQDTILNAGCLVSKGTPIHEIMHALGTFHEQSRWDRDEYVTIHLENIIRKKHVKNFEKVNRGMAYTKFSYDYGSVMHYGKDYFSINRKTKPTITPKLKDVKIGQRKGMSKLDCLKLNDLYGCMETKEKQRKYENICERFGVK